MYPYSLTCFETGEFARKFVCVCAHASSDKSGMCVQVFLGRAPGRPQGSEHGHALTLADTPSSGNGMCRRCRGVVVKALRTCTEVANIHAGLRSDWRFERLLPYDLCHLHLVRATQSRIYFLFQTGECMCTQICTCAGRCTHVCTQTHTHLVYAHARYICPLECRSTVWLPVREAAGRWSSEHSSPRNYLGILRTVQVQSGMHFMFGCRSSILPRVQPARVYHHGVAITDVASVSSRSWC